MMHMGDICISLGYLNFCNKTTSSTDQDLLSCLDKNSGSQPSRTDNELFLLAKVLTANDIKDLKKEEILLGAEKPDDIMIAECCGGKGESAVLLHVYPSSFQLL
eukprot:9830619-Ditylum_brightwellii.AAC.1